VRAGRTGRGLRSGRNLRRTVGVRADMVSESNTRVPLSVLELAPVRAGQSSRDALLAAVAVARFADSAGFRRFWVAEHHNMPGVASTSPAVLIAHVAAATSTI